MDQLERVLLVAACRAELKQRNASESDPRRGESFREYNRRRMDAGLAGDGDLFDTSTRWDRYRRRQPAMRRLFMRRAPRNQDYVGYQGLDRSGNPRGDFADAYRKR